MPSVSRFRRRASPGSLLLLSLIAILALSLGLGYQAVATARSHRESVENALRDYASMAAWEYANVVRENMNEFLYDTFEDVTRGWRGRGDLPSLRTLADEVERVTNRAHCECTGIREPLFFFRLDLRDTTIVSHTRATPEAGLQRLADTLVIHRQQLRRERTGLFLMPAGSLTSTPVIVTFSTAYDASRNRVARALYGYVTEPGAYGELLAHWFVDDPLLPPAVTGGQPNDSLLHLSVRTPDAVLFESDFGDSADHVSSDTMGIEFGRLVVEAGIKPDVADQLIIGGLPRSRLPLVVALLLITVGLGAAALHQLRRERQLSQLREDFVSGVSHELRTPLAQVRMFAELWESGRLKTEEERSRSLGIINREARRLTHLVENILQFSRSGRGTIGLKVERLEVSEIVNDVTEAFAPLARARSVELDSEIEPNLWVRADRDAVKQVLLNLLDNAVKYGPDGQTVSVRGVRDGSWLRLSVEDQGPGVPRSEANKIWEPYHRLQRDAKNAVTGSGIGLAVVHELVTSHDGRVRVDAVQGGGARFVVELPGVGGPPANRGDDT